MKRIAVLGSTGSIGTSCLDVLRAQQGAMRAVALTTHRRWRELAVQCHECRPEVAVIADATAAAEVDRTAFPAGTELQFGEEAVAATAARDDVDVVVSGIVGAAGLKGTWAAVEAGKTVAFANKETLVVAGDLMMSRARERGATLLPVDSEHSAIFQSLAAGRRQDVKRIILTASGGPFREWPAERIAQATVEEALAHPTWNMGPKITIDSATMMNKTLEIIEARWLFGMPADQIDVVVHPQSIVHSMVEYVDGSIIAQMSPPDMRLPIQYALTWPERVAGPARTMDFSKTCQLTFTPPDRDRFPALELGFEVARRGGTCGAVLNAANEVAVERFLKRELAFGQITRLCRSILNAHQLEAHPTLDQLLEIDRWARQEAVRWNS
ncbi:MAG: 1-deoxy-D-xylulose-5-phosphate reductoisomerase [Planctomycetota bacterium]|nr:MAG: 1-deoxy-D-xylulose-5-phosphate reductoisomerase [Planctomycetota bacterium]